MATSTCFSGLCQPCTPANRTLFQLQPQPISSGSTLLISSSKVYRSSFSGARVHQNAETQSRYLSNSSTGGIVATLAPDRSTTPLTDRVEESIGTLKTNGEASSAGREESPVQRENGAAKSTTKYYGATDVTKSLPMGLSGGREYEPVSVKDYLDRARDFIRPDDGPPRWFCPLECGSPPKDAPLLLSYQEWMGLGWDLSCIIKLFQSFLKLDACIFQLWIEPPLKGL